ncbi:hypothetical protein [Bradyrhizobium jicamae]|uniref:hypothetical protein n=1 Tax=Bradyrhizobium jicamae TaxID=280332 RepID=UPI001BA9B825|nr:hypothetical protein [Bradyrhizobium jicamae]MBR0934956.1 hypothetical protein [Bradyrhizobium jicamae]
MNRRRQGLILKAIVAALATGMLGEVATAGPSAEVARKCMSFSYIVYPYKRPGSVRGSGDRQAYFKDCMAKEGKVDAPTQPAEQAAVLVHPVATP